MSKNNQYPLKIGNLFKLSFGEEIGNAISHGIMALLCLLILPFVSIFGYLKFSLAISIGYSVYIICLFLMFLMSTLYHSMKFETNQKVIFRILDHCGIYFAIAGTFTPVCLQVLNGILLYIILISQWGMVLFGILYKSLASKSNPKASLAIYLTMGWTAVFIVPSILKTQTIFFSLLILFGGIFYSVGTYFYAQKTKPWYHFIWHLFVNAASITHLIAIIFLLK